MDVLAMVDDIVDACASCKTWAPPMPANTFREESISYVASVAGASDDNVTDSMRLCHVSTSSVHYGKPIGPEMPNKPVVDEDPMTTAFEEQDLEVQRQIYERGYESTSSSSVDQ